MCKIIGIISDNHIKYFREDRFAALQQTGKVLVLCYAVASPKKNIALLRGSKPEFVLDRICYRVANVFYF